MPRGHDDMGDDRDRERAESNAIILARLDERMKAMAHDMSEMKKQTVADLADLKQTNTAEHDEIRKSLAEGYVSKADFRPVKQVVLGAVGLALSAVFAGLIALVVKEKP